MTHLFNPLKTLFMEKQMKSLVLATGSNDHTLVAPQILEPDTKTPVRVTSATGEEVLHYYLPEGGQILHDVPTRKSISGEPRKPHESITLSPGHYRSFLQMEYNPLREITQRAYD